MNPGLNVLNPMLLKQSQNYEIPELKSAQIRDRGVWFSGIRKLVKWDSGSGSSYPRNYGIYFKIIQRISGMPKFKKNLHKSRHPGTIYILVPAAPILRIKEYFGICSLLYYKAVFFFWSRAVLIIINGNAAMLPKK